LQKRRSIWFVQAKQHIFTWNFKYIQKKLSYSYQQKPQRSWKPQCYLTTTKLKCQNEMQKQCRVVNSMQVNAHVPCIQCMGHQVLQKHNMH
jgi:hypothetical protein